MAYEWKQITNGTYKGFQFHIASPTRQSGQGAVSIDVQTERRLQLIKRAQVDGAKIRDFGSDPRPITLEIIFFGIGYDKKFDQFEKILNEGTAGTLIIPDRKKAMSAYVHKIGETSDHSSGGSKTIRVTWMEETNKDQSPSTSLLSLPTVPSLDEAASALDSSVDDSLSILQDNPFLTAVRGLESGLSTARRAANTVLTLDDAVKNRIQQVAADITGTLALIKSAGSTILHLFGLDKSKLNAAVNKAKSEVGQISAGATSNIGTVDSETGQRITDFSDPSVLPPAPDPLAKPPIVPNIGVSPKNLQTPAGVQIFAQKAIAAITASRDSIVSDSGGRADDVGGSITTVINAIKSLAAAVATPSLTQVVVPIEMSLMEVMFQNGVDLNSLNDVHNQNTHVVDPLVVPKGTVINL